MNTVRISRSYISSKTKALVPALSAEDWTALVAHITEHASPVSVVEFADADGDGVNVTVETERGPNGAYAIHSLAYSCGALAVIR